MHCLTTVYWSRGSLQCPAPLRTGHCILNEYVRSKSGNSLGVWSVENPEAQRVLVFIHGQLGSRDQSHRREAMEFFATKLNAHVVTYDPSGYADSTGWPSAETLHMDAASVLDYAVGKFEKLPVYVWGHSLGGPVAANLTNGRPEVRGIILEATFAKLSEALTVGIYGLPIRWLGERRLEGLVEATFAKYFDTENFIRTCDTPPVFILHGSNDWTVRVSAVPKLVAACEDAKRPHRSFIVNGGAHNDLHTNRWAHEIAPNLVDWIRELETSK